jgi:hypothetical protein
MKVKCNFEKRENMFSIKNVFILQRICLKTNLSSKNRCFSTSNKLNSFKSKDQHERQTQKIISLLSTLQTRSTYTNSLGKLKFHKVLFFFFFHYFIIFFLCLQKV